MFKQLLGIFTAILIYFNNPNLFAASPTSQCLASEVVIWSCSTKKQILSVCASKDLDKNIGYMQYRAGKIGKPEFIFPTKQVHPKGQFTSELLPRAVSLSFKNLDYEYNITEPLTGQTTISVNRGDKPLADIECINSTYTLTETKTLKLFDKVGISR